MAHKYLKHAGLAALLLGGSAGQAQAEPPTPLSPAELSALIGQSKAAPGPNGALVTRGGGRLNTASGAPLVSGWNLQHCSTSVWFTPDNVNYFIYAFNFKEGTFWFYGVNSVLIASAQASFIDVCQSGQLYGVFVTNTSTGAFDEIWAKW